MHHIYLEKLLFLSRRIVEPIKSGIRFQISNQGLLPAQPKYIHVDGNGTVPVESAKISKMKIRQRRLIDLLVIRNRFQIINRWSIIRSLNTTQPRSQPLVSKQSGSDRILLSQVLPGIQIIDGGAIPRLQLPYSARV